MQYIRVWDLPVRLGHWIMAGGFALAWITGDSEEWRLIHVYAGSAVLAVAMFRLLWGFIGSRYARFTEFVRGPTAAISYLKNLTHLKPLHYTGHNPAGGLAILALLALAITSSATGWFIYQEMFGSWPEKLHDMLATAMLGLVVIHLAGVAAGSIVHKENLVRAMITGRKLGAISTAITRPGYLAAIVLIIWTIAISWWLAQ